MCESPQTRMTGQADTVSARAWSAPSGHEWLVARPRRSSSSREPDASIMGASAGCWQRCSRTKAWSRLFAGETRVLKTALPADQCGQRLAGRIAYGSTGVAEQQWSSIGMSDAFSAEALARQPLRGSVNSRGFQVAKRVPIGFPPKLAMARMLFETWLVEHSFLTNMERK